MEEKHAIEVKDLVISYQNLKKTSIKKTLLHLKRQKPDRFVAVKGISFYVREGEILGIIGKNGSGKSTTLNALAGIFSPDSGSIDLNGHSISLLSIGVGFIREMTGHIQLTMSYRFRWPYPVPKKLLHWLRRRSESPRRETWGYALYNHSWQWWIWPVRPLRCRE